MRSQGKPKTREAVGAIVRHESSYLLVYKVKVMDTPGPPVAIAGEWGFPSGGVMSGEDVVSALQRELAEETGLGAYTVEKELPPLEFEFAAAHRALTGFERQHTRMFLLTCPIARGLAPHSSEIEIAKFFSKEEVQSKLYHRSNREYFELLCANGLLD
jgi:putative (di)nucleoside polyphosphate hydrolase